MQTDGRTEKKIMDDVTATKIEERRRHSGGKAVLERG
jgi:hypothetical protein